MIADIVDSSAALLEIFNADRLCLRCALNYKERDNIGQWQCKKFHPLFNWTGPGDKKYKCCARAVSDSFVWDGCVQSDHNDKETERTAPTKIAPHTKALFDENAIDFSHAAIDARTGVALVDRYDVDEYERRVHPTLVVSDEKIAAIEKKLANRNKSKF
jgi:hypothetical protein